MALNDCRLVSREDFALRRSGSLSVHCKTYPLPDNRRNLAVVVAAAVVFCHHSLALVLMRSYCCSSGRRLLQKWGTAVAAVVVIVVARNFRIRLPCVGGGSEANVAAVDQHCRCVEIAVDRAFLSTRRRYRDKTTASRRHTMMIGSESPNDDSVQSAEELRRKIDRTCFVDFASWLSTKAEHHRNRFVVDCRCCAAPNRRNGDLGRLSTMFDVEHRHHRVQEGAAVRRKNDAENEV